MGDSKLSSSFAKDIGLLKEVGISPIIVHGGGPQIGERLKSKNISSKFVDGLRVTDKETIKIVEEVLSKDINSEIVESISSSGGKAIGVSGNINNLITATKLHVETKDSDSNIEKVVDIGFVGQPVKLDKSIITNIAKTIENKPALEVDAKQRITLVNKINWKKNFLDIVNSLL